MPEIPENPFTNRAMITTEDQFIGRQKELSNILTRLKNSNSVSVAGERRIGKSSLLYHLFLTGNTRLGDTKKQAYHFIYIDALDALFSTPADFTLKILETLGISRDKEEITTEPLKALNKGLRAYAGEGTLPILLIDEFEKLSEKRDIFTDPFFENLRSCCNSGDMAIVTASMHSLKELTDKHNLTSPFWNIFTKIHLGELSVTESCNEVIDFIHHLWNPLDPSDTEVLFLLNYGSRHPLVLQVVSFHLYQNRELHLDTRELTHAIVEELESFFRTGPEKIQRWFKQDARIFERLDKGTGYMGKQLKNLGSFLEFIKGGG